MNHPGRKIIEVIESAAAVDWFRCAGSSMNDDVTHVPITVWRFKQTEATNEHAERVMRVLDAIIKKFSGHVPWSLRFSGRNWVLAPVQVQELEDSGQFRTDGEVVDHLSKENPTLGLRAHEDLAAIASELMRHLE